MAMGSRVMDDQEITHINGRQKAPDGKLVIVFTECPHHVHHVGTAALLFSVDADVVIGTVYARPHEGGHAGIHTDVPAVCIFFVYGPCDQHAMGACHISSGFNVKFRCIPVFLFERIICGLYLFSHGLDIKRGLIRRVGDAKPAANVDKIKRDPQGGGDGFDKVQKHFGCFNHIRVIQLIGYQHGVKAETAGAHVPGLLVRFYDLVLVEAVF